MSYEPCYFLVPASSGLCIQLRNGTIYTAEPSGAKEQQWFIERGESGQIAFRNAKDGQYLRAVGGGRGARIVTGQEQYWRLESSNTPNAFWIKCVDFPDAYLCNSYGKWSINNLIYVWAHELRWTQTMLWYVSDFETWKEHKASKPGFDPRKKAFSELESKEKSVAEKQQKLEAREQQLEEQRERQETAEKELEAKMKQLELDSKAKIKELEEELAKKQHEVDTKAKELAEKEEQLHRNAEKGGEGCRWFGTSSDDQQKQLEIREKEIARRKRLLDEREIRLEQERDRLSKQAASQPNQPSGVPAAGHMRAERVQSSRKEVEAANVGQRSAPLGLRTSQRKAIEKGSLRPIGMPTTFVHLPRLRDG